MTKTVLIAEDEAFINKTYYDHLQSKGYNVLTAVNGKEAIDLIDEESPDLLVLDLLMPEVDGFAVLEHLHKQESNIPVLVLSNLSKNSYQERCKNYDIQNFLVKSEIGLDQFADTITAYL